MFFTLILRFLSILLSVLEDPLILELAAKHSCTPAQICLAWILTKGVTLVTKSKNPSRMKENLDACQVMLTEDDVQRMDRLPEDNQQRLSLLNPYTVP